MESIVAHVVAAVIVARDECSDVVGLGVGGCGRESSSANDNGLPGLGQLQKIVGSLITVAVIAAVAGFLISAGMWAIGNHSANPQIAGRGKSGVMVAARRGSAGGRRARDRELLLATSAPASADRDV